MGYQTALEAAGAKVIDTKYIGSYQGTWGCVVEYNGLKGLVTGAYGSCSMCDAFEGEFHYSSDPYYNAKEDKYYNNYDEISKEKYDELKDDYQKRLADFGKRYLHVIQDAWDVQNQLDNLSKDEDNWYDDEQVKLLEWALPYLKIT